MLARTLYLFQIDEGVSSFRSFSCRSKVVRALFVLLPTQQGLFSQHHRALSMTPFIERDGRMNNYDAS